MWLDDYQRAAEQQYVAPEPTKVVLDRKFTDSVRGSVQGSLSRNIVDDSSNDGTSKILKKFKKKNFKHIIRKKERDLSRSCIDGFKKASSKNIIVMDGDLQHKPSDIKKFLNVFYKKRPDFVVGTRDLFKSKKHNLSFFRLFVKYCDFCHFLHPIVTPL